MTKESAIQIAKHAPPRNTPAFGRGEVIKHLAEQEFPEMPDLKHDERRFPPYVINWSVFQVRGNSAFIMPNPFRTYAQEVQEHLKS